MAARALVLLLALSGCALVDTAETTAADRTRQPVIVPVLKGTFSPLCIHAPLLFWEKPRCWSAP